MGDECTERNVLAADSVKMKGRGYTLALNREIGEPTIFDVLGGAMGRLALKHKLRFKPSTIDAGTPEEPITTYYFTSSRLRIAFSEDYRTGVSFVEIHPPEGALTDEAVLLLQDLPIIDPSSARPFIREHFREDPGLLISLIMAEGRSKNEATVALLREALNDPDESVRDCAIEAAGRSRCGLFLEDLARIAEYDPSPDLRKLASTARDMLQANVD
jgi:hypothetical protein